MVRTGDTTRRRERPVLSSTAANALWRNGSDAATVTRAPSRETGAIRFSRAIDSGRRSARAAGTDPGSISRNGIPSVSARIQPRASAWSRFPSRADSRRGIPRAAARFRISRMSSAAIYPSFRSFSRSSPGGGGKVTDLSDLFSTLLKRCRKVKSLMPFGEPSVHGAPSLTSVPFVAFAAAAVMLFAGSGCIVTGTTYEMKAKEADSLRDAMASLNREKAKLAEEVAACRGTEAALSARLAERDESVKRLSDDLAATRRMYEGSRDTREQFIDELLGKEKAAGMKLQECAERADRDGRELERLKREAADRELQLAELRSRLDAGIPESESARRERDILLGRVERLREERGEAATRRDERLAALSASLGKLSREVSVSPVGPALLVAVPENLVVKDRGGNLTALGAALVSQLAAAVADLPSSSLIVIAGGKASAETLRKAAARDKVPQERLFSHVREKEPRTELLLIAP